MENKIARVHLYIEGRVQGVFYRSWASGLAYKLGLTGWVKNLPDGRVEAVFEGPKQKVKEMIEKCKKGSRFSEVSHIDEDWSNASGEFKGFEIITK